MIEVWNRLVAVEVVEKNQIPNRKVSLAGYADNLDMGCKRKNPSHPSHTMVQTPSGPLGIPVWVLGEAWLEVSIRGESQGMNLVRSPSEGVWTEKKAGPRREREGASEGN